MVAVMSRKYLLLLVLALCLSEGASPAAATDSRVEKAREIREQILLKRREIEDRAQPGQPDEDPFEAAVREARERVAAIEAQIADRHRRSQEMAGPREKLQARGEELAASVARVQKQNRARVEAVYRSARLGTGAAGWYAEPTRGVRLSRYLASIAQVQQARQEVVEVEYGSVIASLDRERSAEAAAAAELRVLEAERAEAAARLQQAVAEAAPGGAGEIAGIEAGDSPPAGMYGAEADLAGSAPAEAAAPDGFDADQVPGVEGEPGTGVGEDGEGQPVSDEALLAAARGEPLPGEAADEDSAMAVQRALAKLAEHNARKAAQESMETAATVAGETQRDAGAGEISDDAADAAAAGTPHDTAGGATARAAGDAVGETTVEAAGDPGATGSGDAATREPGVQDETAAPGEAPRTAEQSDSRRRGLLSRMFGSDRQADAFASSRGELPPPVPGKVVANYGQQHKSGATYRGVILRAAHSDPVRAVAEGKVSFAGEVPGLGNTIIVSHGGRYHTVYARLGSLDVKEGENVDRGSLLGELPDDNADLHFELRDGGKAVDPLPWLRGVPGAAPQ